jgi:AcrR family transcriptional regulator
MAKPNKYDTIIKPNLDKIHHERINGASIQDIADMLGISERTLYEHMRTKKELRQIMDDANSNMAVKIETQANHSLMDKLRDRFEIVEEILEDGIVTKQKRRLIQADTTAILFALKSLNPEKWDSLSVARLKDEKESEDLNKQILQTLEKYKPKKES